MKVLKNGMVPLVSLTTASGYKPGTMFGLAPKAAIVAVEAGAAALREPPPDAEYSEVPGPSVKAAAGADKAPAKAAASTAAVPDGEVEIPPNWDKSRKEGGLQWMQKVALAERILGVKDLDIPEGKKPQQVAEEVIRAELERRAAAESTPQT